MHLVRHAGAANLTGPKHCVRAWRNRDDGSLLCGKERCLNLLQGQKKAVGMADMQGFHILSKAFFEVANSLNHITPQVLTLLGQYENHSPGWATAQRATRVRVFTKAGDMSQHAVQYLVTLKRSIRVHLHFEPWLDGQITT